MKVASLEAIFRALQEAQSRYIVVGGVAVMAHGYSRMTQDLDLVLDLSADSLHRSLEALQSLGYRPINPVGLFEFANPEKRREWAENRNQVVFNLVSDRFADVVIDVFTIIPFDFDTEYEAASWLEFAPGIAARVIALDTLIALKAETDRPRDKLDIAELRKIKSAE